MDDVEAENAPSVACFCPVAEPEVFALSLWAGHVTAVVSVRVGHAMLLTGNGRHHHMFGDSWFKSDVNESIQMCAC